MGRNVDGVDLPKPPPRLNLKPIFNHSIEVVEDTDNHTTSDVGSIVMCSIIDKTGIIPFLVSGLYDPWDQNRITHSLSQLLIQCILMLAPGYVPIQPRQGRSSSEGILPDQTRRYGHRPRRSTGIATDDVETAVASQYREELRSP